MIPNQWSDAIKKKNKHISVGPKTCPRMPKSTYNFDFMLFILLQRDLDKISEVYFNMIMFNVMWSMINVIKFSM